MILPARYPSCQHTPLMMHRCVDAVDKWKRFGFPVEALTEAFARMVHRVEILNSNSHGADVAEFFLDIVERLGFTSERLAIDPGTENYLMAAVHHALVNIPDNSNVKCTHSHQNIVAEISNGKFGAAVMFPITASFKELEDTGWFVFHIPVYTLLMRACFLDYLRALLQDWRDDHNTHPIRKQARLLHSGRPWGRVDLMYSMPQRYGATVRRVPVSQTQIAMARDTILKYRLDHAASSLVSIAESLPERDEVYAWARQAHAIVELQKQSPLDLPDMIELYKSAVRHFRFTDYVLSC